MSSDLVQVVGVVARDGMEREGVSLGVGPALDAEPEVPGQRP